MSTHESLQRLLNTAIFDLNGVRSGRLADVLVDPGDGRVEYVQIALDSSVSGGERYAVVPWSTLGVSRPAGAKGGERWFVNVRREALERIARLETRRSGDGQG
jgi:sporulation protein YlmC with PRC-barrel domain